MEQPLGFIARGEIGKVCLLDHLFISPTQGVKIVRLPSKRAKHVRESFFVRRVLFVVVIAYFRVKTSCRRVGASRIASLIVLLFSFLYLLY